MRYQDIAKQEKLEYLLYKNVSFHHAAEQTDAIQVLFLNENLEVTPPTAR